MAAPTDKRLTELSDWVAQVLPGSRGTLIPASGDASFRRYFRTSADGPGWIVMDAPPATENLSAFVDVAELLKGAAVTVPDVRAADLERGFAVLSDLGQHPYQDVLANDNADRLYRDALAALTRIQDGIDITDCRRPEYDEALLRRELLIFSDWFLGRLLGIELDAGVTALLENVTVALVASALEQPRVFVHRDYHSRNLMVCPSGNPGILDFQDAVIGPVTYDLVSLLRDCYVAWPESRVARWRHDYLVEARRRALLSGSDLPRFERWFDLMGMQRHLKAVGIFARLKVRDGKGGYLADIPRTLDYVYAVCGKYPEFADFGAFLRDTAGPAERRSVFA
ncbi:MAG: aminoglycoside phosphotransferase [Gammaproteobacteria bacterium]|nr:aminoglycoside phosphotransferase [Gammaproteobacteria bacterium]